MANAADDVVSAQRVKQGVRIPHENLEKVAVVEGPAVNALLMSRERDVVVVLVADGPLKSLVWRLPLMKVKTTRLRAVVVAATAPDDPLDNLAERADVVGDVVGDAAVNVGSSVREEGATDHQSVF
eukprot:scpid81213/ scgid2550/ 